MIIRSRDIRDTRRPSQLPLRPRANHPQAYRLVGWWPVQTSNVPINGAAQAGSVWGKNLVGAGNTVDPGTSSIEMVPDPVIGAMWFSNGGNSFIPLLSAPNPAGSPLTVSFWIKTTDTAFTVPIFFHDGGSPFGGFSIGFNVSGNNGFLNYWGGNGAGAWKEGNVAMNDGLLHHCAVTVNGTAVAFFVDGRPAGTAIGQQPTDFTGNKRFFSATDGGGSTIAGLTGSLADIRIYEAALSPDTIWSMFAPATRWDLYTGGAPQLWIPPNAGSGGAGKGRGGGKKGGGGGLSVLNPFGAYLSQIGNAGLDIGST